MLGEGCVLRQPPEVIAADDEHATGDDARAHELEERVEEGGRLRRLRARSPQLL